GGEMAKRGRLVAVAAAAAMLLAVPDVSFADSATFNAIFFKPALGRNPYLMLEGTQTLHQLQFDVGEIFSYGYRPLQIVQGGARSSGVIDHLLVSDFVAAIGATEWLQFGIDVPLILINKFSDPQATPQPPMSNHFDIGDLRIEAKARVLDSCDKFIGLAFVPFVTVPTGKSAHYVADPGVTGGLKIALDGRVHPNINLTFNIGYQGGRNVDISNINYQHNLLIGAGILGILPNGVNVSAEVNAKAAFNKLFANRDLNPAEAMVGVNWDVKESGVTIYGGGGTCLTCGVGGAKARAVIGAKYRFNPRKFRDLDSEHDSMCRMQFGSGMSYAELKRLKGICPPDPADYQAGVHDAACPKYYDLREIAGLVLRCPPEEAYRAGIDDPACPKVFDLSSSFSKDEIMSIYTLASMEMSMLCPPDAADFNPQLHDLACPKYYDLRGALSDDVRMSIFELAEQAGIVGGEIKTLRPIYFDFNSWTIRPDMEPMLGQVLAVINANTWIRVVKIGGHADSRGTAAANDLVAKRRSDAVVAYMREHGVRSGVDFRTVSYGAWRPAAPNDTEEGRALNRRVVFMIGERGIDAGTAVPVVPAAGSPQGSAPDYAEPRTPQPEEPPAASDWDTTSPTRRGPPTRWE
ncbi:MAG TPA: OmpA family protein, partial [bacterium]|nr:OmpA family protein [bacterium]